MSGGLILPAHLRDRQPEQHAERSAPARIVGPGREVRQRAVWMGRKGWRHEVTATWVERQAGEATQVVDTLWMTTAADADRLAAAAADELRTGALRGLSDLARRLRIELPRA